jgi:hypothetical protein
MTNQLKAVVAEVAVAVVDATEAHASPVIQTLHPVSLTRAVP